jgi:hypothetical protein
MTMRPASPRLLRRFVEPFGEGEPEGRTLVESGLGLDPPAQPPNLLTNVLARPDLGAGAPEKVERAAVVARIDAAAVVPHSRSPDRAA